MHAHMKLDIPTTDEISLAKKSCRLLALCVKDQLSQSIQVIDATGKHETVCIPTAAFNLLIDILSETAQGNAVSIIPIHAVLTTQEAADMLNVSRPYFVKLLDSGALAFTKVGTHRRVRYQDLMAYKAKIDAARLQTLEELTAQAQALNMGY